MASDSTDSIGVIPARVLLDAGAAAQLTKLLVTARDGGSLDDAVQATGNADLLHQLVQALERARAAGAVPPGTLLVAKPDPREDTTEGDPQEGGSEGTGTDSGTPDGDVPDGGTAEGTDVPTPDGGMEEGTDGGTDETAGIGDGTDGGTQDGGNDQTDGGDPSRADAAFSDADGRKVTSDPAALRQELARSKRICQGLTHAMNWGAGLYGAASAITAEAAPPPWKALALPFALVGAGFALFADRAASCAEDPPRDDFGIQNVYAFAHPATPPPDTPEAAVLHGFADALTAAAVTVEAVVTSWERVLGIFEATHNGLVHAEENLSGQVDAVRQNALRCAQMLAELHAAGENLNANWSKILDPLPQVAEVRPEAITAALRDAVGPSFAFRPLLVRNGIDPDSLADVVTRRPLAFPGVGADAAVLHLPRVPLRSDWFKAIDGLAAAVSGIAALLSAT